MLLKHHQIPGKLWILEHVSLSSLENFIKLTVLYMVYFT